MTIASCGRAIPVSQLNRTVAEVLTASFPPLWVAGEVSNLTRAASGHWYFVLKDQEAQVRCVMFRNKAQLVPWPVTNGDQVEVFAQVGFYAPRGEFQLNVDGMRRAGLGALFEAFERLKAKLSAEGLFDAGRKRALPGFPRRVGVVTSPQAAALRDVLTALRRRAPHLEVVLYPAPVQGADAPALLTAAVRKASERAEVDVLIVCRGGGSIEDLWAFNDEGLARAMADCPMPVVSGVGHETDFTIADFVADLRAATPTAAAELVSPDGAALRHRLEQQAMRLSRAMSRRLETRAQQVDYLARRLVHPGERLARQADQLCQLESRLMRGWQTVLVAREHRLAALGIRLASQRPEPDRYLDRLNSLSLRLSSAAKRQNERRHARLDHLAAVLGSMNPDAVLARGYSLVTTARGEVLRRPGQVRPGERLHLKLSDGSLDAAVLPPDPQQASLPLE